MRIILLAAAAAMTLSTAARAEDFVRGDCRAVMAATSTLHFDSPEHARWYKRFWTGACDDLSFCLPGSPNWNDVVSKLLARGGAAETPVLLPKACRLGQLIGLEWSREKRIRKISTSDLRAFSAMLRTSGDALAGVEAVETKAKAMVAAR